MVSLLYHLSKERAFPFFLSSFLVLVFVPTRRIELLGCRCRLIHFQTSSIYIANRHAMSGIDAEEAQFQKEVQEVKQWWSDSRWRYTRRPFTAEDIVSKRGNLKITYPSNSQSKKLWDIVEGRFKVR